MTDPTNPGGWPDRYLIRKGPFFYRPNSKGYTWEKHTAGRYTLADAEKITHPNGRDGPRDGMSYVHESEVPDDPAIVALVAAQVAAARAEEREACSETIRHLIGRWRTAGRIDALAYGEAIAAAIRARGTP